MNLMQPILCSMTTASTSEFLRVIAMAPTYENCRAFHRTRKRWGITKTMLAMISGYSAGTIHVYESAPPELPKRTRGPSEQAMRDLWQALGQLIEEKKDENCARMRQLSRQRDGEILRQERKVA